MNYRQLGKTGLHISEIGFGAWGIGKSMWIGAEDSESTKALSAAIDLGINFFDTAYVYGHGHSEQLIGKLLKSTSEEIYIASKIPPKNLQWPAPSGIPYHEAFTKSHIIEYTEKSLKNLRKGTLDLQQLHVWNDEWVNADEIWEAVDYLKRSGKIRFFGISINDHAPSTAIKAAKTGLVDAFQVIYNIFDQSPEDELFPYCQEHRIGIIVRVPLDEGGLTGRILPSSTFPEHDWRNNYFRGDRKQQVYDRVEKLKPLLGPEAQTVAKLALKFCLTHPAVSTVIPGMRTTDHVEINCEVSNGRPLSEATVTTLRQHRWIRNFYGG